MSMSQSGTVPSLSGLKVYWSVPLNHCTAWLGSPAYSWYPSDSTTTCK